LYNATPILLILFLMALVPLQAQRMGWKLDPDRNKGKVVLLHVGAGIHVPGADLAQRFGGPVGSTGIGLDFMSANNLLVGGEAWYFFGDKVKEDPLSILRLADGGIIGNDQSYASFLFQERGVYFGARVGKVFGTASKRSGIRATLGAGFMQHKIRIQDNALSLVQVTGQYAKGYDRSTGGLALQQYIGWQHLGLNRRTNWNIGLEFAQGFTNTLRSWDFSTMGKLDARRLDLRFGLRATWMLPFYMKKAKDIFY
jgi:hypothetical protein